jgi:hypothetical protein
LHASSVADDDCDCSGHARERPVFESRTVQYFGCRCGGPAWLLVSKLQPLSFHISQLSPDDFINQTTGIWSSGKTLAYCKEEHESEPVAAPALDRAGSRFCSRIVQGNLPRTVMSRLREVPRSIRGLSSIFAAVVVPLIAFWPM